MIVITLSTNPTKWSNTQTILWKQPTNCWNVFDHFVGLALKVLIFIFIFTELGPYQTSVM